MTIRAVCPSCQLACRVEPRFAGGIVRCPGCKSPFTAPAAAGRGPLSLSAATSPGRVRSRNEDGLLTHHLRWSARGEGHEAALAFVADGMGGHADGDRAAALAVGAVARALLPKLADVLAGAEPPGPGALEEWLDHALWEANRAILHAAEGGSAGMGATAVAALVYDGTAAICHVGDCRAYLLRGARLERRTRDQTLLRRMIELGQISAAEADGHPAGHQVSQALGRAYGLEPERQTLTVHPGDVLLLACDGVHGQVSDEAIRAALPEADAAARLVRLADEAGGKDNSTAVVLRQG